MIPADATRLADPMASGYEGARRGRIHPIVDLGYRVRIPAHLFTLIMLASSFASTGASASAWLLALFYGLAWAHLARFIGTHSLDSRSAELRNLVIDSAFAGTLAALSGFSLWPSVVLVTGINAACLSVGGARFALRAFAVCALSAAFVGAFTGYRFSPNSTVVTSLICALSFLGYTVSFSLRTHIEAKRLVHAQRELRAINARMEEQGKRVEHALELAEAANQAKSAFLANMSHELRTPLNAIIGYAELLQEDVSNAEQRADLQRIHTSGKHLLGLINDVLDLSKIEAGKVEPHVDMFDVGLLIQDVVSTMRPLLDKNANRLVLRLQEPLGVMSSDAARLRQVLLNLLSNAAKFTSRGEVGLSVVRIREEGVENLVFEITDTGIGMSSDQLDRLFTPFFQADTATTRLYSGTGMGLAISRGLTEMLGGRIDARSEVGRGAAFRLTVPAQAPLPSPLTASQSRARVEKQDASGGAASDADHGDVVVLSEATDMLRQPGMQGTQQP
ncbi:MAG: ATP-binding protein [Variovorax sp.]